VDIFRELQAIALADITLDVMEYAVMLPDVTVPEDSVSDDIEEPVIEPTNMLPQVSGLVDIVCVPEVMFPHDTVPETKLTNDMAPTVIVPLDNDVTTIPPHVMVPIDIFPTVKGFVPALMLPVVIAPINILPPVTIPVDNPPEVSEPTDNDIMDVAPPVMVPPDTFPAVKLLTAIFNVPTVTAHAYKLPDVKFPTDILPNVTIPTEEETIVVIPHTMFPTDIFPAVRIFVPILI